MDLKTNVNTQPAVKLKKKIIVSTQYEYYRELLFGFEFF